MQVEESVLFKQTADGYVFLTNALVSILTWVQENATDYRGENFIWVRVGSCKKDRESRIDALQG